MVELACNADINLVIDGCPKDCGKKIFGKLGLTNLHVIRVTDCGIKKAPNQAVTEAQISQVVTEGKRVLSQEGPLHHTSKETQS